MSNQVRLPAFVSLALLAVAILIASPIHAQNAEGLRVAQKGELRAALIASNPVLVTHNPDGQLERRTLNAAQWRSRNGERSSSIRRA